MKKLFPVLLSIAVLSLFFPLSAGALANSLVLCTGSQEAVCGEEFTIEIVGNGFSNIVGGDIYIDYDKEKLQKISTSIMIPKDEFLDIQEQYTSDIQEGRCRCLFAIKKNAESINCGQKTIARVVFKATNEGEASVGLGKESRLVQESDAEEPQAGKDYRYISPINYGEDIYFSITAKQDPDENKPPKRSKGKNRTKNPATPAEDEDFDYLFPAMAEKILKFLWEIKSAML